MMELHDPNESVLFSYSIMGNYTYEIDFGNFKVESSSFVGIQQHYEIFNLTYI